VDRFDNQPMVGPTEHRSESSRLTKILHYGVAALLLAGAVLYWWMQPPGANPMADPASAEAMALVQTHRALQAPTLRQAIDAQVRRLGSEGKGVRTGQWRVTRESPEIYVVDIIVREQGSRTWFEREYRWRVHLPSRAVTPITMAAADLMPNPAGQSTAEPTVRRPGGIPE
jgi:hypothetical protein